VHAKHKSGSKNGTHLICHVLHFILVSRNTVIPQWKEHILILKQIDIKEGEPWPKFVHDSNKESLFAMGSLNYHGKIV
jgi:hypothetical protein